MAISRVREGWGEWSPSQMTDASAVVFTTSWKWVAEISVLGCELWSAGKPVDRPKSADTQDAAVGCWEKCVRTMGFVPLRRGPGSTGTGFLSVFNFSDLSCERRGCSLGLTQPPWG